MPAVATAMHVPSTEPAPPTTVQRARIKLPQLEMLRGFAATYVVLHHLAGDRIVLLRFGQEAVILFFLLSGFVIYLSTSAKPDMRFQEYFILRFRRIFPVFILALGLSYFCLDRPGDPSLTDGVGAFFGNLLMMQDCSFLKPGVFVNVFCGNSPLWSLSYEWWFYIMFFPIQKYVAPHRQAPLVFLIAGCGFVSYTMFPNGISLFALYFLIWWSGVELARTYLSGVGPTFRSEARSLLALGTLTICLAWLPVQLIVRHQPFLLGVHPFLELRHFGAALVLLVAGLVWHRLRWIFFRPLFGAFGWLAPISYGLYAFHVPLFVGATYLDGRVPRWSAWTIYLIITLTAAYGAEVLLQRRINRFLKPR